MAKQSCPDCSGTGHPIKAKGNGIVRDYASNCGRCWGTGQIELKESVPTGGSGCVIVLIILLSSISTAIYTSII